MGQRCLPGHCSFEALGQIDSFTRKQVTYNAKSAVFMQQAPFTSFFVVKSGSVKTVHVNERGDERILGFYFPGELFGLDGLTNGTYGCTALALERSMICRLNMDRLEELGAKLPQVQHWLLQTFSQELSNMERMTRWLSYGSAEERVVGFLLDMSRRHRVRRLIDNPFRLAMARSEIANYLGLALETVSRVLTRLQRAELIRIRGREVELLDTSALAARQPQENPASLSTFPIRILEVTGSVAVSMNDLAQQ
jgi:CRP/FNR family transcriptional regulator